MLKINVLTLRKHITHETAAVHSGHRAAVFPACSTLTGAVKPECLRVTEGASKSDGMTVNRQA